MPVTTTSSALLVSPAPRCLGCAARGARSRACVRTQGSSRRVVGCKSSAASFVGSFDPLQSSQSSQMMWNAAALVVAAVAAFFLARRERPAEGPAAVRECPKCGGTGYEVCFCSRWSDGDVGCSSCNYTGYTRCKACGGGGTAVPIALKVRKDDGPRQQ